MYSQGKTNIIFLMLLPSSKNKLRWLFMMWKVRINYHRMSVISPPFMKIFWRNCREYCTIYHRISAIKSHFFLHTGQRSLKNIPLIVLNLNQSHSQWEYNIQVLVLRPQPTQLWHRIRLMWKYRKTYHITSGIYPSLKINKILKELLWIM